MIRRKTSQNEVEFSTEEMVNILIVAAKKEFSDIPENCSVRPHMDAEADTLTLIFLVEESSDSAPADDDEKDEEDEEEEADADEDE